jgi:hypothetical protein
MTVSSSARRISYAGNGSSTGFAVPFKFLERGDLRLVLRLSSGAESVLALDTDYAVAGAGNDSGGTVTAVVAPPAGSTLLIKRVTPRLQPVDFTPFDAFPAETQERALDRGILITQEDGDELSRALVVPETDSAIGSLTLPSVAARGSRILAFDAAGVPVAGPLTNDLVALLAIAFTPGLTTLGSAVTFTAAGAGAQTRSIESKGRERIGLMDFIPASLHAAIKAGTDITNLSSYIAAAVAACPVGGTVFAEQGVFKGLWQIPATKRITIEGDGSGTIFTPVTAGDTVIDIDAGAEADRQGWKLLRHFVIDGNGLANITGIACLDDAALLYFRGEHLTIRNCAAGGDFKNIQESGFADTRFIFCTVGLTDVTSVTDGGGTALSLERVRFQQCDGGFVGISASIYPAGQWQWDAVLFQNNKYFAMALYGGVAASGAYDGINIDGVYWEANGARSSPGETLTWKGKVIPRCAAYIENAYVSINGSQIGENTANVTSFILRNNGSLSLRDNTLGGGTRLQVDADATSRVFLDGRSLVNGTLMEIADWGGFVYPGGGGGYLSGTPILTPTPYLDNRFVAAGGNPDTPAFGSISGGVSEAAVFDSELAYCKEVTFAAGAGSTGGNNVVINAITDNIVLDDGVAIGIDLKATADMLVGMRPVGAGSLLGPGTIQLRAGVTRRVWMYNRAGGASAGGYPLYIYPAQAGDGRVLRMGRVVSVRTPAGQSLQPLNDAIRRGRYSNGREPIYAPAPPASGTWPRGKRVINSAPATGSPIGWTKVTTGAANVVGTDWRAEPNL